MTPRWTNLEMRKLMLRLMEYSTQVKHGQETRGHKVQVKRLERGGKREIQILKGIRLIDPLTIYGGKTGICIQTKKNEC